MHLRTVRGVAFALLAGAASPLFSQSVPEALARADVAWAGRAEGHVGGRAAAGPIGASVAACEEAIRLDGSSLEAHWRLMRALWFLGDFATQGDEARKAIFARGREVGEHALDLLAARLAPRIGNRAKLDAMKPAERATAIAPIPGAVQVYFWSAVNWGLWGEAFGTLAAARQGVAGRIRDYTETVVAVDERFERAGGRRVLGRLHDRAPSIPFITGWVDHERSIRELRRALEIAPDDLYNRLYLVEALRNHGDGAGRAEADALLADLLGRQPAADTVVEDSKILEMARALSTKK